MKSLTKSHPKYAYELAVDLLETLKSSGCTPHPQHFVMTAKAAEAWWKSSHNDRQQNDPLEITANDVRNKILDLYKQAEAACEAFPVERNVNRLFVITRHAIFLHKYHITQEEKIHLKQLSDEGLQLLNSGTNGSVAVGEWYEMLGDEESDTLKAEERYLTGVRWVPKDYAPLWIKLIGVSFYNHGNLSHIKSYLDNLPIKEAIKFINWAEGYYKRKRDLSNEIIKSGVTEMKKYFNRVT